MKKKLVALLMVFICLLGVGCSSKEKKKKEEEEKPKIITIAYEETVAPMVIELAKDFNLNSEAKVNIVCAEREEALVKLKKKQVDILIGYVDFEDDKIKKEVIGFDGIAIIVNRKNPLESIDMQQFKKTYVSQLKNWRELNGLNEEIQSISYKNISSIQKEFEKSVMNTPVKEMMGINVSYVNSVSDSKARVIQSSQAIGYIPGQYVDSDVKKLKLNGIELTIDTLKNQLYPLKFDIFMYYFDEKKDEYKDFFQYLKSDDGRKTVRKSCMEKSESK